MERTALTSRAWSHQQRCPTGRSDTERPYLCRLVRVSPWAVTKNQCSKKTSRKKLLATLRKSLASGTPVQVQQSVEPHEVLEG